MTDSSNASTSLPVLGIEITPLASYAETVSRVAGKAKWAPAICRKTGTEWLYRLATEPRRWRRQLALPVFATRVLWERAQGGGKRELAQRG